MSAAGEDGISPDSTSATAIVARAEAAGLSLAPSIAAGCARYLDLLRRWNARINLTALSLADPLPPATIDKLIIEPLCAVDLVPVELASWLDLGSGGGSPAIPLRLARPHGSLTMVESRERKGAFLREAVRMLEMSRTVVLSTRFEQLDPGAGADLITIRAVRIDARLTSLLEQHLRPSGRVLVFGGAVSGGFEQVDERRLPDGSTAAAFRLVG